MKKGFYSASEKIRDSDEYLLDTSTIAVLLTRYKEKALGILKKYANPSHLSKN